MCNLQKGRIGFGFDSRRLHHTSRLRWLSADKPGARSTRKICRAFRAIINPCPKPAHNSHTCAAEIRLHRDLRGVLLIRRLSDYRSSRRGKDRASPHIVTNPVCNRGVAPKAPPDSGFLLCGVDAINTAKVVQLCFRAVIAEKAAQTGCARHVLTTDRYPKSDIPHMFGCGRDEVRSMRERQIGNQLELNWASH
jgi:hypothetical protein